MAISSLRISVGCCLSSVARNLAWSVAVGLATTVLQRATATQLSSVSVRGTISLCNVDNCLLATILDIAEILYYLESFIELMAN